MMLLQSFNENVYFASSLSEFFGGVFPILSQTVENQSSKGSLSNVGFSL